MACVEIKIITTAAGYRIMSTINPPKDCATWLETAREAILLMDEFRKQSQATNG